MQSNLLVQTSLVVHSNVQSEVRIFVLNRTFQRRFLLTGSGLNLTNVSGNGGLNAMTSTSSSYVQRSQGNITTHSRYDTIEKTTTYSSSSRNNNNYSTVDASRVHAHGEGLTRAYRNEKATFNVDTREGGKCRTKTSHKILLIYKTYFEI